jgi:hypothetical protein
VGRLIRTTIRTVIVSAALGAAVRVVQAILRRRTGGPEESAVRTGSFDSWPTVPTAPDHPATGD